MHTQPCPPGDTQVVLQMPRGNLEAVRPRALVLPAVAAALDARDYAAAWALATTNRLDLNVLVDYRWPEFVAHAREFVRQARAVWVGRCACSGLLCKLST